MPEILTLGSCVIFGGLMFVVVAILSAVKLLYEYERGVVFTLGKYRGTRNPGLTLIFPVIQSMRIPGDRSASCDH